MGDRGRAVVRGFGELLVTLGVVLLLFCVYELEVTGVYTAHEQTSLALDLQRQWATTPAPAPAPTVAPSPVAGRPSPSARPPARPSASPSVVPAAPVAVEPGDGIAVLRVPRLGRDWSRVVVEGVGTADLKRGPGHYPGTALPGEVGNVVLSGHRTTYGEPFNELDRLRPGDAVVLETRDAWSTYRVTGTRIVLPSAIEVTYPVPGRRGVRPTQALLTLTTCNPKYSAKQRLVVSGLLQSRIAKGPGVVPPALTGA